MIILDLGAGDATGNDINYVKEMMAELPPGVTVKFQLFKNIPGLKPLDPHVFMTAWAFGQKRDIPVTASVFDEESLNILTRITKVPFIKIACRPHLYDLISGVPKFMPVLVSVDSHITMMRVVSEHFDKSLSFMCCVPEYPANTETYESWFSHDMLRTAISDHTIGTELYDTYRPKIWEKHFGQKGPDVEHAITLEELQECLK